MGFDFAALWSPWIIFGITSIVVVTMIIILTIVEKILDRKIRRKREEENKFFREKISYLKSKESQPEQFLVIFNQIVLEVFKEALGLHKEINYDEAIELFRKNKNFRAMNFADKVQKILYAGEGVEKAKLNSLLRELTELINDFRKIHDKRKSIGKTTRFEDFTDLFFEKINSLKDEFNKFEKIGESVEKEFGSVGREISNIIPKSSATKNFRVVPVKKEKIQHRKVRFTKKDSSKHKKIRSIDDLARIREKIGKRKER